MLRRCWLASALLVWPLAGMADVCRPGATLTYPNHELIGWLGLTAVVDARDFPAFAEDRAMSVGERVVASNAFFADAYGDEPQSVLDLRKLGMFVEHFNLTRGRLPRISGVFFEPEYVLTVLPVLRQYEIESGVAALEATEEAFWFFEDVQASSLLRQLMFDDVIGATIGEVRETAPDVLAGARAEVDAAVEAMAAEDPSVAAMLIYLREGVRDSSLGSHLASGLWDCIDDARDRTFWEPPENWDELPQPQRDMLVLLLLEHQIDRPMDALGMYGWLFDDIIRVTEAQDLAIYADTLRQVLALFPEDTVMEGDAWIDLLWAHEAEIEAIFDRTLYGPLVEVQGSYEVLYSATVWDGFVAMAKGTTLWPQL